MVWCKIKWFKLTSDSEIVYTLTQYPFRGNTDQGILTYLYLSHMIGKSCEIHFRISTGYFRTCNLKTPTLILFWYWTVRTMYVRLCTHIVCMDPYVQKAFILNVIRTKSVSMGSYVQCTYIVRTFARWERDLYGAEKLKYKNLVISSTATFNNERITECGNGSKAMNELVLRGTQRRFSCIIPVE